MLTGVKVNSPVFIHLMIKMVHGGKPNLEENTPSPRFRFSTEEIAAVNEFSEPK
jgi:hypothetical protein